MRFDGIVHPRGTLRRGDLGGRLAQGDRKLVVILSTATPLRGAYIQKDKICKNLSF